MEHWPVTSRLISKDGNLVTTVPVQSHKKTCKDAHTVMYGI